jgi:hypothetical protein
MADQKIKPTGIIRHQWAPPNGTIRWTHCTVCGVIQRRDGHQQSCKGPVKVVLRNG